MRFEDMLNQVIEGDCLVAMKQMPDKCVDLVVTDPPYSIDAHGGGGSFGSKKRTYHAGVDSLSMGFSDDVLKEVVRVSKKVNAYIFCNKNQIIQILTFFKDYNYDILTYHKTNPTPTCNNKYLSDTEYIIYVREKGVPLFGSYYTNKKYFLQENGKSEFEHPTVKPINIIATLISNSSKEGDIIFDPFLGAGTTAVAAKQLGRKFIGIEISEEYCEIARQRLRQDNLFML